VPVVAVRGLSKAYRQRPVPLSTVCAVRRVSRRANALSTALPTATGSSEMLRSPALRQALADMPMGIWSASPAVLNFLEGEVQRLKPSAILEFGSGLSTVCLAHYLASVWNSSSH